MKKQIPKGNVMLILTLFISLVGTTFIITSTKSISSDIKNSTDLAQTKQSFATAESGFEDVLYRLKSGRQVSSLETMTIGNSTSDTIVNTINSLTGGTKELITKSKFKKNERLITSYIKTAEGASFNYGVQIGKGGLSFNANSKIYGNVYSAGDVNGTNNARIQGSLFVSDSPEPYISQSNGTGSIPSHVITFGKTNAEQDFAQTFKTTSMEYVSKVRLYIRKVGNPSDGYININPVSSTGVPSNSNIGLGVTLKSSSITSNFEWVEFPINMGSYGSLPAGEYALTINTNYSSSSPNNYYEIGANIQGYSNGRALVGITNSTWKATDPAIVTGSDSFFEFYQGGYKGSINYVSTSGDLWANKVRYCQPVGNIYCKIGESNSFNGQIKNCDTSKPNPQDIDPPISESMIKSLKDSAESGTVISGNVTITSIQNFNGNHKIIGNLIVDTNSTLIIGGNLWVTGTIEVRSGAKIKLDSSLGSSSATIISEDLFTMTNSSLEGTGSIGSYIVAISTRTSKALSLSGATLDVVYAPYGTADLWNKTKVKSIYAFKLVLNFEATITYESGLTNVNFVSGPGGSWQIDSWKEGD